MNELVSARGTKKCSTPVDPVSNDTEDTVNNTNYDDELPANFVQHYGNQGLNYQYGNHYGNQGLKHLVASSFFKSDNDFTHLHTNKNQV